MKLYFVSRNESKIEEVTDGARFRLYRAHVHAWWVLDPDHDVRIPAQP